MLSAESWDGVRASARRARVVQMCCNASASVTCAQARLAFAQEIMEGNLALAQPQPAAEGEFAAY